MQRVVILAGDCNVARLARSILDQVVDYRSREVILNRKETTEDVTHLIDAYEKKPREVPRLYVLHVSVNDIPQGDQPDAIPERLRWKWSDRKKALVICSVPEVKGKGKGIQALPML